MQLLSLLHSVDRSAATDCSHGAVNYTCELNGTPPREHAAPQVPVQRAKLRIFRAIFWVSLRDCVGNTGSTAAAAVPHVSAGRATESRQHQNCFTRPSTVSSTVFTERGAWGEPGPASEFFYRTLFPQWSPWQSPTVLEAGPCSCQVVPTWSRRWDIGNINN